jgi:hypothetical protein
MGGHGHGPGETFHGFRYPHVSLLHRRLAVGYGGLAVFWVLWRFKHDYRTWLVRLASPLPWLHTHPSLCLIFLSCGPNFRLTRKRESSILGITRTDTMSTVSMASIECESEVIA